MTSCRHLSDLVVVDSAVANYAHLIDSISLDTHVLVLDGAKDGVEQITQALATHGQIQSLHILSHGSSGVLQLGSTQLSRQTLGRYTTSLQAWAKALATGAEILLYGCEVAAGAAGRWFVRQLHDLTGANIAASTNLTGNVALGGDWILEFVTADIQTPMVFSPTAMATYPHVLTVLVTDDFRGSDVVDRNWRFGVGDAVGSVPPQNPFLTARPTVTAPTGGLPGNPGTPDAVGEGALRLTNSLNNQASFVYYDVPVRSNDGLTITFEIFAYSGTGADGISFFLLDGSLSPTEAGAFGGSLGYAQKELSPANPFVAGLAGAFVGIGFDEFGNFSSATDNPGDPAVRTGGPGRIPDSISIRAGQTANYAFVAGTNSLPFGIDVPSATTRDASRRTVKIDLTPEGQLSVRIDANNDGDFLDPGESNEELLNRDIDAINGVALPPTFKFGFASGTGDSTNIHEVRNLFVSTLNSPPQTADFSQSVLPGSISLLQNPPGFSATDPDVASGDFVASYSIVSLPPATQGVLYLGNPASGGTPVVAGANLTPQQIQTVFFQASAGFTGTTFTYLATDSRGSSDPTPATVTLIRDTTPVNPPVGNNLLPNTAPSSVTLAVNSTALVPNLSGSDPDGTVVAFRISTLPPAAQGTLFLGNPASGGAPITTGQRLTAAQIQQVFFRSSSSFSGSQFTYAAIDNQGGVDPTPAPVDLDLKTVVLPRVCRVGREIEGPDGGAVLRGTRNLDEIFGGQGNDKISGLACNDLLDGGQGRDRMWGGSARDRLLGRQNADVVNGNDGADVLNLGLGSDQGFGGPGNDRVAARRGNDLMKGRGGNDELFGGRGQDRAYGNANNDFLDGQQNDDFLKGGDGSDRLNGGLGNDRHRGGRGTDRIVARRGDDVIWGGKAADELFGNLGNDRIAGHTQDDRIVGGGGNDRIIGGGGNDRISLGAGADIITYRSASHGLDRVSDFNVRVDKINLRPIFNQTEYNSSTPFETYVRLTSRNGGTLVSVDSNGGARGPFAELILLAGVPVNSVNASSFLV